MKTWGILRRLGYLRESLCVSMKTWVSFASLWNFGVLGRICASLCKLGTSLGCLKASLCVSMKTFGATWAFLCVSMETWASMKTWASLWKLGRLWSVFRVSLDIFMVSLGHLYAFLWKLGASWGVLERHLGVLGHLYENLGAIWCIFMKTWASWVS